jgi:hypothetical protein
VDATDKRGCGESSYKSQPAPPRKLTTGTGYYLAAEEDPLELCQYQLKVIDQRLKIQIHFPDEDSLKMPESRKNFVVLAHKYFNPTPPSSNHHA